MEVGERALSRLSSATGGRTKKRYRHTRGACRCCQKKRRRCWGELKTILVKESYLETEGRAKEKQANA
ncbi:hypothetical protein NDU88_004917 [Pleurodeles waltl]|uniref:Uncharacterized protein n=1 Tax=Pleurodeles waltl TaxID=8319 RepID=A0AAV7TTB3_PLEWA|nr:hypothetical protein NDU88_004917 [Pleurodeles waltl]